MNILIIIFIIWLLIDIARYIKYCNIYHKLNITENNISLDRKKVNKFLLDLENEEIFENIIIDTYYSKVKLQDMNYDDVCDSIYDILFRNPLYVDNIKRIVKRHQHNAMEKGTMIFNSNKIHDRFKFKRNKIQSWFTILPIYLITKSFDIIVKYYMKTIGYQCNISNNIRIWYNKYDPVKGTPLVFFHPAVGGVSSQFAILKILYDSFNIIMPEISGLSFVESDNPPLNVNEVVDIVIGFVNQYEKNYNIKKINIMGHSMGNIFCSGVINKYPELVNNFFCIEGQIFCAGAIGIYSYFESDIYDMPFIDLLLYPLLNRDLFLQYYLIKCVSIDICFIYDLNDNNNKHINIYMFHVKNDNKIRSDPQIRYAVLKNIPIKYHLFEGNYQHGSFVTNNAIKHYIIDFVMKIYENDKI